MEITQFIIAIFGMLVPIGILSIIFGFENRSEARYHETIQRLIENGQTIDEELLSGIPGYKKKMPRNDIRTGMVTFGVGLGLALLGFMALGSVVYGAGFLVMCIGIALFLYGLANAPKGNLLEKED